MSISTNYHTALYCSLSKDDDQRGGKRQTYRRLALNSLV